MIPVLLELQLRALRGRLIQKSRLLRQPRYLMGFLVGAGWLGFFILRPLIRATGGHAGSGKGPPDLTALLSSLPPSMVAGIEGIAALLLAVALILWWLIPFSRPPLKLTEAEIDLLLPAPLTRRQVMGYGLARNQPGILFGASLITLLLPMGGILNRCSLLPLAWILLTLWDLHSAARNLWYARQRQLPPAQAIRSRGIVLAVLMLLMVMMAREGRRLWLLLATVLAGSAGPASSNTDLLALLQGFTQGSLFMMLAPLRWLLHPLLAVAPLPRLVFLLFPVLLLTLHYLWVLRSSVSFEAAVEARAKRRASGRTRTSRRRNYSQRARQRQPFHLNPTGFPELALVWKNLLQVRRLSLKRTLLLGTGALLGLVILPPLLHAPSQFFFLVTLAGGALLAFLPLNVGLGLRNDLRTDLLRLDIIRPWPVDGGRLVLAEAVAPGLEAVLRGSFYAGLILAGWTGWQLRQRWAGGPPGASFQLGWGAALGCSDSVALTAAVFTALPVALGLGALSLAVMNMMAVSFPGWIPLGPVRRAGAGDFGQNMLTTWGLALLLLLGLLPGGLLAALPVAAQWFLDWPFSPWEGPFLALLVAACLVAEAIALLYLVGQRFEALDPSREILAGEL